MKMILRSLLLLSAYLFLLVCSGIEGSKSTTKEYLQLKRPSNIQNKLAVKIIQTIYGDTYACIDFYKQPAFDHPLLQNHSYHYQMEHNSNHIRRLAKNPFTSTRFSNIWLNGKGCPNGTVPIRRITKDELIRANKTFNLYDSPVHGFTIEEPGIHYAIIRTEANNNAKYNGAAMIASVHQPKVTALQFSGSQMKLQSGSDTIQVGWAVNPNLNLDNKTRLFILTHTSQVSCFNLLCPGFVLTRQDLGIDVILEPISQVGGPIYAFDFHIERDDKNGDWRLIVGPEKIEIGFWPAKIFTGLSDLATHIEWGGEVYSPIDIPSPPMGVGDLMDDDTNNDAFCYDIGIIDESHKFVSVSNIAIEHYADSGHYQVSNYKKEKRHFGHIMFYGGDGGATGN